MRSNALVLGTVFWVAAPACKGEPKPEISKAGARSTPTGQLVAAPAPAATNVERVPPPKPSAWTRPSRPASDQEQLLAGTWVATVGDYATRSRFMADRIVLALESQGKGQDVVESVVTALAQDDKLSTACVWLELRVDFTGFRRECALVNGVASAMDENDLVTGAKSDLGTKLEWYIDEADRNGIKIHFAADMVVPAPGPAGLRQLVFRDWTLRLGAPSSGENRFTILESVPEHDYELPTHYVYQIASGSYL